jgi:hypothetical protein
MTQLLNHALRRKRDLLRLRQRTRQLARALGFAARDQALIAASVFHLGCCLLNERRHCRVAFHIRDEKLQAQSESGQSASPQDASEAERVRLEWPLPCRPTPLTQADLAWAMQQLERLTPLNLFDEVKQQNLDLLQALRDLHDCRAELGRLRCPRGDAA